jgi:SSS family solute:Na+ symporter/sodium/proline symporter
MIYITVVTLYVLMLLGISVYKSRSVKTDEDFMVAGRDVPVYMLVATLVCTWIGSGSLFGWSFTRLLRGCDVSRSTR